MFSLHELLCRKSSTGRIAFLNFLCYLFSSVPHELKYECEKKHFSLNYHGFEEQRSVLVLVRNICIGFHFDAFGLRRCTHRVQNISTEDKWVFRRYDAVNPSSLKKLREKIYEHQTWKKQRLAGIKFHSDYFIGVDRVFLLLAPLKKRVSPTNLRFVRFPVLVFIQILFCWFNQDEELATRYDVIPYRGSRHVYMPVCVRILGAWKRIKSYCQNLGYQSEDIFPFSAAFHISAA